MRFYLGIVFLLSQSLIYAQYAPPVGQAGTTAIGADSSLIDYWAGQASVVRGYEDIALQNTLASHGTTSNATGSADNNVISLGDSGIVTYQLANIISNHPGAEFAVFENSFSNDYLELAFVEVSSDGQNFTRFPAYSETQTAQQTGTFGLTDATEIKNLAGKYKGLYGTPFDLADLSDSSGVDINNITHIRIVDVVGSVDPTWGTYDSQGNLINDPYPTEFSTGGFDLDALAVLKPSTSAIQENNITAKVYPNPVSERLFIQTNKKISIEIVDLNGKLMHRGVVDQKMAIDVSNWAKGTYLLRYKTKDQYLSGVKKMIKH